MEMSCKGLGRFNCGDTLMRKIRVAASPGCSGFTYHRRVAPRTHRETTHQERGETGEIPNRRPPGWFTRGSATRTTVFKHTQVCFFRRGKQRAPPRTLLPSLTRTQQPSTPGHVRANQNPPTCPEGPLPHGSSLPAGQESPRYGEEEPRRTSVPTLKISPISQSRKIHNQNPNPKCIPSRNIDQWPIPVRGNSHTLEIPTWAPEPMATRSHLHRRGPIGSQQNPKGPNRPRPPH